MIKLEIVGRHFDVDDKVREYLSEKIASLDKYAPREHRDFTGQVILEEDASGREGNRFVCEVNLEPDGTTLHAKEGTVNIYAAIDICEAKLKAQLAKYKAKHSVDRGQGLRSKLWGQRHSDDPEV